MTSVRGGIYIDKGVSLDKVTEFGLCIGAETTLWFETAGHIDALFDIQEIGGMHNLQLVEGYSFGINKTKKEWHVRDTGHKNCKHILWKGEYSHDVEKEIEDGSSETHEVDLAILDIDDLIENS